MTLAAPQDGPSLPASPPTAAQLQSLMNAGNHRAAAALLDGVDLAAETAADLLYYAAVCLGDVGRDKDAVELLERAVAGGFIPFWCTYHLGLFEARRGRPVHAACYYSIALILDPVRTDIQSLLEDVVPGLDLVPLATAQCRRRAPETARVAKRSAEATLKGGNVAAAAHYLTVAVALDPADPAPREQLAELVTGLPQAVLEILDPEADECDGSEQPGSNAGTPPSAQQLAALLNAVRFSTVPSNAGIGLELKAIAAVVVGGTAITGGRGVLIGTLIGVALLGTIGTALTFVGINPFWEKAIQGAIILAALGSDFVLGRVERMRAVPQVG